jgi:hypothetical protein
VAWFRLWSIDNLQTIQAKRLDDVCLHGGSFQEFK